MSFSARHPVRHICQVEGWHETRIVHVEKQTNKMNNKKDIILKKINENCWYSCHSKFKYNI